MKRDALLALLDSWVLELTADNKSVNTVRNYRTSVVLFADWAQRHDRDPNLDKPTVLAFAADLIASGAEPATVHTRVTRVRRFSAWLAREGEIRRDGLAGVKPPRTDEKVVDGLTEDECSALIKACAGKTFRDRRDEAIARVMIETGLRASEMTDMTLSRTDVQGGTAVIVHGKGGKGRVVPFSPYAARAIDRYLRLRRAHRLAGSDHLWLGERGKALGYTGLYKTLGYRAQLAGIANFHPHRLRHTMATRWLAAGGSEGGLMAVAGWSTPAMLHRYVKATRSLRATDEARRLNLGDL